jgi:ring-1,2-phenylacetyl-CoA epoxidase subunit PaaE
LISNVQKYTLTVLEKISETTDAITLKFKQPGLKKIKYLSGQYLTVILKINNRRYIRPYSLSSAPGIESTLDVTVKRVPGGVVSNHIIDKVNVGDVIEVIEPMGDFTLNKIPVDAANTHLVLWGSGSGVTPLMSIAKNALQDDRYSNITFVYGNRSFDTTIFYKQLHDLQSQFHERFSIWHFHTKSVVDHNNPYIIQGRINPKQVLDIMSKQVELQNTYHYICGPVGLKESIKSALSLINIDDKNVFSEDFEIIRDPKDFEGVLTQTVTLNIKNNVSSFEVTKGKSILEAGLDVMLDLSYSCQTGNCLLCKATLLKGKIKTIGIIKSPNELNHDECLLCCSFPLSDDVEILVNN